MAAPNEGGYVSRIASAAVTAFRAVEMDVSTGKVAHVNAVADVPYGIAQNDAATGEHVTVKLLCAGGEHKITAAAAISASAGQALYMTSAGKFQTADPGSGVQWFRTWDSASADGDIITAVPMKL